MENQCKQLLNWQEGNSAANRELGGRLREKNNPKAPSSSNTPIPGLERVRQYSIRRQQSLFATIPLPTHRPLQPGITTSSNSAEGTRTYRHRIRLQYHYMRRIPGPGHELSRRWYAKKKQAQIIEQASHILWQEVPLSPDPPPSPDANIALHIQVKLRKKAYMNWPYLCNKIAHLNDEILTFISKNGSCV